MIYLIRGTCGKVTQAKARLERNWRNFRFSWKKNPKNDMIARGRKMGNKKGLLFSGLSF